MSDRLPASLHRRAARISCVLALMLTGCADMCANRVLKSLPSPDGQRMAVVFERDCGATTGYATGVSIIDAGDAVSGGGSAFHADDDHGRIPYLPAIEAVADVRWIDDENLRITYAAGARIFDQDDRDNGVSISYASVRTSADR